jgi:hypothetical protein
MEMGFIRIFLPAFLIEFSRCISAVSVKGPVICLRVCFYQYIKSYISDECGDRSVHLNVRFSQVMSGSQT